MLFNRSWLARPAGVAATLAVSFSPASAAPAGASAPTKPLYKVTKSVPIGEPDGWDLLTVDSVSHRVYIAQGDHVTVVDGSKGVLIGRVGGFPGGAKGVAAIPQLGLGYSDDASAGIVSAFSLQTLKPGRKTKVPVDADAILFDQVSGQVFVISADPGKVTAIDPKTGLALATINGGGSLDMGVVDGKGKLYVNGAEKNEIIRIDTRSNKIDRRWPLAGCVEPHGLAVDTAYRRLFSSCSNKRLVAVNADTGKLVASLPIGSNSDGAAFDPVRKRVFSSNGDGTLTVIGQVTADTYKVIATIPTMFGSHSMALDRKTGRLYVVAAKMTENTSASPTDYSNRFTVTPGSTRLLFFDPVK